MNKKKVLLIVLLIVISGALFIVIRSNRNVASGKQVNAESVKRWTAPSSADNLKNPLPYSPPVLREGENLYKAYCVSCHGKTGLGDGSPGKFKIEPANFHSKTVSRQTDGALFWKMTEGRGIMPAFKAALSEEQRWQLVAFIRQFSLRDSTTTSSAKVTLPLANYRLDDHISSAYFALPEKLNNIVSSESQLFSIDTVVTGLNRPWSMVFLPDKSVLITERSGHLLLAKNGQTQNSEITGNIPKGLRDIKLDPEFKRNKLIYFSYYIDPIKPDGGYTVLMRARFEGNKVVDEHILYKAGPFKLDGEWYGSKIAFDRKGYLFFTVGIRGKRKNAQDISNPEGKTMRFKPDGSIPPDNPFVHKSGALPEIYSYGHRMHEGLACDPKSGKMYSTELGELGGDELNIIKSGLNYGWPLVTYSLEYNGSIISKSPFMKGMEPPIYHYAIAPSDLTFVYGKTYPHWNGNIFIGGLASKMLYRIVNKNDVITDEESLLEGIGRVRDVKYGPDGYLYVMTEDTGIIVRLLPVKEK